MIIRGLVIQPYATNCYIVGSESTGEGMVIDPGGDAGAILKHINETKLDIKYIVLTHGHIDHIGAVGEMKEATGAAFCVHSDESSLIQDRPLSSMVGSLYPALPFPDRWLRDGDRLDVGELHFEVLHTPGHSPGGISLLGEGVVFPGDTLFNYGIGRTDFPNGSHSQLMNSIHTRLMTLPDNTVVYSGHGPESTIGAERRGNPWLRGL
ncbi:MAG: MBL fold metallo-hydrolase [Chloroflexi bacterium]|nr:MBL fold metallo-hydrolase [Chloroflexota bacterium]